MSDNVLFKTPKEMEGNELDQIQSILEIPKTYFLINETDSKKDLKGVKKQLKNLKEKSKYNENYYKELICIENVKDKHYYRRFGVY